MNHNTLFDEFYGQSELTPSEKNRLVLELKKIAATLQAHPEQAPNIAYSIAGLMAADFARKLPPDDPIDEILTIAGELEINPDNADRLRMELVQKIKMLS